ncbi:MAG: flagella basal body P-ring formation protein FlgA, partial [Janthinobacterium lividum]
MFGLDRMPNGQVRIRLRCHEAGACVAFSVTVDRSGAAAAKVQEISTAAVARERQPMQQIAVAVRPSALPGLPEPSLIPATAVTNGVPVLPSASVAQVAQLAPASVRVGAKLTLLMEEGHMHIHLPVIAIDNSTAGNEIRVTTPDHKQMFRAVVVDAATVRGIVQ